MGTYNNKMDLEVLLNRFEMIIRAEGKSDRTIDHIRLAMKFFNSFLGGISDFRKITDDDLRHFILYLQKRPKWAGTAHEKEETLSDSAVNTYTRGVKLFWAFLEREGVIKHNPLNTVRNPKIAKKLPKVYTQEQIEAVFKVVATDPRERALILLLIDTGITLSELVELNNGDVNIDNGEVKVFREKTMKERYVFISQPTVEAIEAYRSIRPKPVKKDRLFLTWDGYPLSGNAIQSILARIGEKADLDERLGPHRLRHTFATLSLKFGSNMEYLKLILGHDDVRTTSKHYVHATRGDVARAHKDFSPVVNLGFQQNDEGETKIISVSNGEQTTVRIPKGTGSSSGRSDMVIVIQPEKPFEIQPVSYIKKKKKSKKQK
jgi:site-specific recombinase XerD